MSNKFCPECGAQLTDKERSTGFCHLHQPKDVQVWQVDPVGVAVATKKPTRKLPETDEEREEAYNMAFARLSKFFEHQGFQAYVSDYGVLMVGKGRFTFDVKIVDNDGRTAYVTSHPGYNPDKAGTKYSNAKIITSRTAMKARKLLRITATGDQSIPIYVELRKNIADPELHICKSVLFVLDEATNPKSQMGSALRDRSFLKGVPPEWLPQPGDYDQLFGIHPDSDHLIQ